MGRRLSISQTARCFPASTGEAWYSCTCSAAALNNTAAGMVCAVGNRVRHPPPSVAMKMHGFCFTGPAATVLCGSSRRG
jgi:hypothetical protein